MKAPDPNDRLRNGDIDGFRSDFDAAHAHNKREKHQTNGRPARGRAAPWWRDPCTIPPRRFLFKRHYIRGAIGGTIGAGGRGKTTLGAYEAISMGVGRDLMTGDPVPEGPLRVWVLNAEEDQDELDRRYAATCQYYGIKQADLGCRLFVESIRDRPWRIATLINSVPTINADVVERMKDFITTHSIDVFTIDPLISFHAVNESANTDMDLVVKEGFGAIAGATNSAGELDPPAENYEIYSPRTNCISPTSISPYIDMRIYR